MEQNGSSKSVSEKRECRDDDQQTSQRVKLEEGGASNKVWDGPSPQLSLLGNYLPEEIRGEEFPESPSATLQFRSVVDGNACFKTKGRGRVFLPTAMLKELCDGESRTGELYELLAAPGVKPKSKFDISSDAKFRSDVLQQLKKHHDWYWQHLIEAIKPVSDYISEKYGVRDHLFSPTSFAVYPNWSDIFHICQCQIDIDLIFRRTLTAECDGNVKVPATSSEIQETKEYLKTFQTNHAAFASEKAPIAWILDNNVQLGDLDEEERCKLKEYRRIEVDIERIEGLLDGTEQREHGTKVFKFVAATSASNIEIRYINIADSKNNINFQLVAKALEHIILSSTNEDVISINCSFSLHPPNDPSALIQEGFFKSMHETIHKMGFIIFAASGNAGHVTAHHPWGQCPSCIVVGAEDDVTKKIAAFSSGCCDPSVDVMARGTNFAVSLNACWYKFGGTSFSTATLTGSFSFLLPVIWTVDEWKTIHEVVKNFISSTSDRKVGCGSLQNPHVPMQWNKFIFRTAINNLVLSGKLPTEWMSMTSSPGSSTYAKVKLRNRYSACVTRFPRLCSSSSFSIIT